MSVVADASPLIFLGKIKEISLVRTLFKGPFLIPSIVYREVLNSTSTHEEKKYLSDELKRWKIRDVKIHFVPRGAGSSADWSVFQLACATHPIVTLADDKFLRGLLSANNLAVLGTLGALKLAARKKVISDEKTVQLSNLLISKYNLWIDAFTYSAFLKSLKEHPRRI